MRLLSAVYWFLLASALSCCSNGLPDMNIWDRPSMGQERPIQPGDSIATSDNTPQVLDFIVPRATNVFNRLAAPIIVPCAFEMLVIGPASQVGTVWVKTSNGRAIPLSVGVPLIGNFPANMQVYPYGEDAIANLNLSRLQLIAYPKAPDSYALKRAPFFRQANGTVISEPWVDSTGAGFYTMCIDHRNKGTVSLLQAPADIMMQFTFLDAWNPDFNVPPSGITQTSNFIPIGPTVAGLMTTKNFDIPLGAYYLSFFSPSATLSSANLSYIATFEDN